MRYTRGVEAKGDMRGRLAEFQIDKVEVKKDTPTKQLGDEEIDGEEMAQLRRELGGIQARWDSGRSEEEDQQKRPLLDSDDWRAIEEGYEAARSSNHLDTQTQQWETVKWRNWIPNQQKKNNGFGWEL